MVKRLVWFAFRVPKGELRAKSFTLQRTRDSGAFGLIAAMLGNLRYRLGPPIFNFPRTPRGVPRWLRKRDLIVMTTRPPLNRDKHKKKIDISESELEREIFYRLGRVFKHCSRSRVEVSDVVKNQFAGKRKKWMSVDFEVNSGGSVKYARSTPSSYTTLGYIVFMPTLSKRQNVISLWGAGGTETYVLAYLASTRLKMTLEKMLKSRKTYLLMCEFDVTLDRFSDPPDMTFASKSRLVVAGCTVP
jgi:hypothetical protein